MDREEQLRRIAYFEAILDELTHLAADPEAGAAALRAAEGRAKELEDYYTGADWKRDFADDEAGLLPKELRRGVLSEDGIWDALEVFRARLAELPDELPPRFASLGRVSPQGIDPRETSVAIPQGIDPRETSVAIPQGGDTLTDDTLLDT